MASFVAPGRPTTASLTYLGHSTVLVAVDELRILTDPLLAPGIGPIRRQHHPSDAGLFADLDAVFISHAHHDHLHLPSLRRIGGKPRLIVPRGMGPLARKAGLGEVVEVVPGDRLVIDRVELEVVSADHSGRREPFGPDAPALGCMIRGSRSVYFAGDTDVCDAMRDLGPVDVALLPVWGWGPRLGVGHMNPERAAMAAALIRPRTAVPIHWGTYYPMGMRRVAPGPLHSPGEAFRAAAARLAPDVDVRVVSVGGTLDLETQGRDGGAALLR